MNIDEAKELLSFHSGRNSDTDNPKWENGFMGSLRPFGGKLHKENLIEVMECLRVLKGELSGSTIDRNIVADIIGITYLTRIWASPSGMLGSNHLLTENQTKHLMTWVDIIEECLMYLLDDAEEEAFLYYEDYLNGVFDDTLGPLN